MTVTEAFYLKPFLKFNSLLHGGRTWRLSQFHVLSIFLVQKVEKFTFFPRTHQEIFINFRVLRPQLATLFFWEIGEITRIHFNYLFDGGLFLEVLRWWIKYLREVDFDFDFFIWTVSIDRPLLRLFGCFRATSFDFVRLLRPWHSQRFNYSGVPYRFEKRDKTRRKLSSAPLSHNLLLLKCPFIPEKFDIFLIAFLWIIFQFNAYRTTPLLKNRQLFYFLMIFNDRSGDQGSSRLQLLKMIKNSVFNFSEAKSLLLTKKSFQKFKNKGLGEIKLSGLLDIDASFLKSELYFFIFKIGS